MQDLTTVPQCSATISELTKALCKAQGELENAEKDATNPHFKSSYATLASVINAIKKPLSANGLAYTQYLESVGVDLFLVTKLMHVSGEWQSSRLHLLLTKHDMQGLGSALSYARRYALSAIVGIAQEDDDGHRATVQLQSDYAKPSYSQLGCITYPQSQRMLAIAYKNGWTLPEILDFLGEKLNITDPTRVLTDKYDKVCEYFEKNAKPKT